MPNLIEPAYNSRLSKLETMSRIDHPARIDTLHRILSDNDDTECVLALPAKYAQKLHLPKERLTPLVQE